jgi:hypothetical protein
VAYLNEPTGEYVHAKAPQELFTGKTGCFLLSVISVVFKTEYYFMFAYFNNTMVGNCHTVGVLSEISHNMFRFSERRLTVNNPAIVPCFFNLFVVFGQDILTGKMLFHSGHEPSPELKAKPDNRIKVFACLADLFHAALNGIAKRRNYAVDMRMKAEVLPPGMQYAYGAAFRSVMTVTK